MSNYFVNFICHLLDKKIKPIIFVMMGFIFNKVEVLIISYLCRFLKKLW